MPRLREPASYQILTIVRFEWNVSMSTKAPAKRSRISEEVEQQIIRQSKRRCCLCFGLNGDEREKSGQLAHINRDPANSDEQNLAYLCLEHHSAYDTTSSQTRRFKPDELRHYKTHLYKHLGTLRIRWRVIINAEFETFKTDDIEQLRANLERIAGGCEISVVSVTPGSVILKLESSIEALDRVLAALHQGTLAGELGVEILDIDDASDSELHSLIRLNTDLISEERLTDALECCEAIVSKFPDSWQPWLMKSNILLQLHRKREMGNGIDYLQQSYICCCQAIDLASPRAGLLSNKGLILSELGRHDEALKCHDAALKLEPQSGLVWFNKAAAMNNMDRFNEAEELLVRSSELGCKEAHEALHMVRQQRWQPYR